MCKNVIVPRRDADRFAEILSTLRKGLSRRVAAGLVGWSPEQFKAKIKRHRRDGWLEEVRQAETYARGVKETAVLQNAVLKFEGVPFEASANASLHEVVAQMHEAAAALRRRKPAYAVFAFAYVASGSNAKQAATMAGYSPTGAHQTGPRLRDDPEVAALIERIRIVASHALGITIYELMSRLYHEACTAPRSMDRREAIRLLLEYMPRLSFVDDDDAPKQAGLDDALRRSLLAAVGVKEES